MASEILLLKVKTLGAMDIFVFSFSFFSIAAHKSS